MLQVDLTILREVVPGWSRAADLFDRLVEVDGQGNVTYWNTEALGPQWTQPEYDAAHQAYVVGLINAEARRRIARVVSVEDESRKQRLAAEVINAKLDLLIATLAVTLPPLPEPYRTLEPQLLQIGADITAIVDASNVLSADWQNYLPAGGADPRWPA